MPESAALVGNGAIHDYGLIASLISDYDLCIAVDGGLVHCQALQIVPDLIIGDFDSISPEILKKYPTVPTEIFPIDKDQTDMELAIDKVNLPDVKKIALFGAMEKRTDHALSNLHLMRRQPDKIVIETERETIFSLEGEKKFDCRPGQLISHPHGLLRQKGSQAGD